MKIWLKYLIGIVLGVAAALIIPFENRTASDVLAFLTDISVRFGRYTILPVLFFSFPSRIQMTFIMSAVIVNHPGLLWKLEYFYDVR